MVSLRFRKNRIQSSILTKNRTLLVCCMLLSIVAIHIWNTEKAKVQDAANVLLVKELENEKDEQVVKTPPTTTSTCPSNTGRIKLVPETTCETKLTEHFDLIYANDKDWKVWARFDIKNPEDFYGEASWPVKKNPESTSGWGSNLGYSTEVSLKIVKETIQKYNITSMLDVPCGDVNWIMDSWVTDSLPVYVGLDIVTNVIAVNQVRFAHHVNKKFAVWDAVSCALPQFTIDNEENHDVVQNFELVHFRDLIQHLKLKDGVEFVCNVLRIKPRILITTSYPHITENKGLDRTAEFYENNLQIEPFNFPKDAKCTFTHSKREKDVTCVYDLETEKGKAFVKEFMSKNCILARNDGGG